MGNVQIQNEDDAKEHAKVAALQRIVDAEQAVLDARLNLIQKQHAEKIARRMWYEQLNGWVRFKNLVTRNAKILALLMVGVFIGFAVWLSFGRTAEKPATRVFTFKPAPAAVIRAGHRPKPPKNVTGNNAWIICHTFPNSECNRALNIAWCESGLNIHSVGDHGIALGMFQMHPGLRETYPGFNFTAKGQSRHALRVWNATNRQWNPTWSCKPAP